MLALHESQGIPLLAIFGQGRGQATINLYGEMRSVSVQAHQSSIARMVFAGGRRLVTCSEKGTNIRIFDAFRGELIQELLRGNEYANVYSLATDPRGLWLAIASDSCNVHMFALKALPEERQPQDPP